MLGNFQARVLLTVFYFVFAGPTGLALRLLQDPLGIRRPEGTSYWLKRNTRDLELDDARRQF